MPARFYGFFRRFLVNRHRRKIAKWYMMMEESLGARDFIDEDPAVSVANIISQKAKYVALAEIYNGVNEADVIIVDGDGDIIFSTPPRRETLFLLAMIELGIQLKKDVVLVNSMISDCPMTGRNLGTVAAAKRLLTQCSAVALRDPVSFDFVRAEMPGVTARYIPDSLFWWYSLYNRPTAKPPANGDFLLPFPERLDYWGMLDFSQPYICIGGGALAASQPARAIGSYVQLVQKIKELGLKVYLAENDAPDSFLHFVAAETNVAVIPVAAPILMCGAVLASASLFISGRYHPSILASLGGTPCIFLDSHAHKMSSLAKVLGYESDVHFSTFPEESDISGIVELARRYLDLGESFRAKIRDASRMRYDEVGQLPNYILRQLIQARRLDSAIYERCQT
jgi:polysaccharide pyruvyl transferase WcaK-like protein